MKNWFHLIQMQRTHNKKIRLQSTTHKTIERHDLATILLRVYANQDSAFSDYVFNIILYIKLTDEIKAEVARWRSIGL